MDTDPAAERHMRRAIEAALLGPENDPNPRVGCVIADGEEVIAVGHHRGAGTPHAEVDALARAGERARGATAYVTLEPCHHTGRTGPCTRALRDAGIRRVRYAVADPNPDATGGSAWLRDRGLAVESGPLVEEAAAVNATWLHLIRTGRPWVIWKFAATLDGRSAASDGTSRWITGSQARADVHAARARCGAVVAGTGTILVDDPHLSVRDADGRPTGPQPLRVVVGERDIPSGARVLDGAAETLLLRTRDPQVVLAELAARGIHRVWLEGGPTLAAAFLRTECIDEVIAWIAPALLGSGRAAVADLGIDTIGGAIRLRTTDVAVIGGDVRITARPAVATESSTHENTSHESTTDDAVADHVTTASSMGAI